MPEYEPVCLEEGPDEASTCYLPLGHDVPHDWTPTEPGYSPEFTATSRGLTAEHGRPGWWMDHLGEWHKGEPPWDRCPHGVVGGDVWCHHCDGEPF